MSFDFERLIPMFGIPKTEAPTINLTEVLTHLTAIQREIAVLSGKSDGINVNVIDVLKHFRNRHKVSVSEGTETIYDDDSITALQIFDLLDSDGNRITKTTDIVESVPR